nr:ORF3 [TTV-like mini virus]
MHFINFILSGAAAQHQWKTSATQQNKKNSPIPITSSKNLRSRIQKHQKNITFTNLTNETDSLQTQLQKDLKKTLKLQNILQNMEQKTSSYKYSHHKKHKRRQPRKKAKKRSRSSSSSSSSNETTSDTESTD